MLDAYAIDTCFALVDPKLPYWEKPARIRLFTRRTMSSREYMGVYDEGRASTVCPHYGTHGECRCTPEPTDAEISDAVRLVQNFEAGTSSARDRPSTSQDSGPASVRKALHEHIVKRQARANNLAKDVQSTGTRDDLRNERQKRKPTRSAHPGRDAAIRAKQEEDDRTRASCGYPKRRRANSPYLKVHFVSRGSVCVLNGPRAGDILPWRDEEICDNEQAVVLAD